ncbi:5'-deoxynucleotidase [Paraferrimonas haliotis]|uniref:5'-deoxynucleotidase n=1 Tax=Paraferrimonas haliotis TaxID=2013866 RepID=A0AA37TUJ3_9GAMM|nr:5'-deoxynucleotidase [Paraferrimonas haliotis]GLS84451.1 5'-deoxynucleotidase [Paraferrimonas haliotis]
MSHFFAHLARMKLIMRWPLMHNHKPENVQEHSLQVAMVAHALGLIHNKFYQGSFDANQLATMAIFHDASEILTGDLPTPVKYFNKDIETEYKKIEAIAEQKLLEMIPADFRSDYQALIDSSKMDERYKQLVKSADTLCAYIKCLDELKFGNQEFTLAKQRLEAVLNDNPDPAVKYFRAHFIESFSLSLDEINQDL